MDTYRAKGWTFRFEGGSCHVGGWEDCVATSPRYTFEVNVDLDGWHKPLTEERLLAEDAFALAAKHDDAIQECLANLREEVTQRLTTLYRNHQPIPETIRESVTIDLNPKSE